jgi:hypothetical protein
MGLEGKRGGAARTYDAEDRNHSGVGSGREKSERGSSSSSRRNDISAPGEGWSGPPYDRIRMIC